MSGGLIAGLSTLALALPATVAAASAPPAPIPVIIDADIGDDIDDAFAVAVALSDPRLEVIGVTTAFGDTRTRVLLARRLLNAIGRSGVVIAQGPATPDPTPFTQKVWALGESDIAPAPDAIDFIRSAVAARPGRITLIELAPMTSLQVLIDRDPATVRGLKQVVLMGGSIHAGYEHGGAIPNPTPDAEYNIARAPKAFAALLASGVAVRMFPLDSTQIKFDEVRRDRLFAYGSPTSDALTLLYHQWRLLNSWGQITPTLFDAVPVAWMLDPSICRLTPLRIAVDGGGFTRPVAGPPNADVCLSADEGAVQSIIMGALAPDLAGGSR